MGTYWTQGGTNKKIKRGHKVGKEIKKWYGLGKLQGGSGGSTSTVNVHCMNI